MPKISHTTAVNKTITSHRAIISFTTDYSLFCSASAIATLWRTQLDAILRRAKDMVMEHRCRLCPVWEALMAKLHLILYTSLFSEKDNT